MDNRPVYPSSQLKIEDVIGIAKDGAEVIGGLLDFISKIVHQVGHVNHPVLIDKLADAMKQVNLLSASLDTAKDAAVKVPTAAETP